MSTIFIRIIFIFSLMISCTMNTMAQGDTPPDDPGNDPALPVDGGSSLLLAAGAAYGARSIYRHLSSLREKK